MPPFYSLTNSLTYYLLTSRKGHGRWGLRAKPGGGWEEDLVVIQARHSYLKEVGRELGKEEDLVVIQVCGVGELVLRPTFGEASWSLASDPSDPSGPTSGIEVRGAARPGGVRGQLDASAAAIAAWSAPPRTPPDALSLRIEGSGAYRGFANPNDAPAPTLTLILTPSLALPLPLPLPLILTLTLTRRVPRPRLEGRSIPVARRQTACRSPPLP
eukprot:scaffold49769_cov54-Phaeocystis_antarctica.AAC.6